MEGDAEHLLLSLDEETRADYTKVIEIMHDRYKPKHKAAKYHDFMRATWQGPKESVTAFANRVRRFADRGRPAMTFITTDEAFDRYVKQAILDASLPEIRQQ